MNYIKGKEPLVATAALVIGVLFVLVGGLIGKTVAGWILFVVGLLVLVADIFFFFNTFSEIFKARRIWALVGVGVLALLFIIALVAMLVSATRPQMTMTTADATAAPVVATTDKPVSVVTDTPTLETPAITETLSQTAAAGGVEPIFVCLNEKAPYGLNIRVAPKTNAAYGGIIEWGSCFTVDARAAGYTGWYHVTPGQEGNAVGVSIGVDESKNQLWVNGEYLESFTIDLDTLPELEVQE